MYTLAQLRESRLCDAAELLAQRGLDNVRAAELARATRLSVGSLYRYYGSKQGIARAIRTLTERDLSYACFVAYQIPSRTTGSGSGSGRGARPKRRWLGNEFVALEATPRPERTVPARRRAGPARLEATATDSAAHME
ncbi:helix-turn-helix domain-containing protein [Corallococcus macrosporus]|uniref:TetR family transcriptional regulator n=1 Tax=Myxococcus fulvus (strain ATCC BAA-855 / HW-1) TaxID=483219 RepID=F8CF54_MYXFH|nr:helix-turn-helix domain-containing protein [Corallococcus macrosporus]AEI68642.1 TetR family transcriptional regulator [Corallococcus macrosporus]